MNQIWTIVGFEKKYLKKRKVASAHTLEIYASTLYLFKQARITLLESYTKHFQIVEEYWSDGTGGPH